MKIYQLIEAGAETCGDSNIGLYTFDAGSVEVIEEDIKRWWAEFEEWNAEHDGEGDFEIFMEENYSSIKTERLFVEEIYINL